MTGIAGEIVLGRGGRASARAVDRMIDALPCRVRARSGLWDGGWVVLGGRRRDVPLRTEQEPVVDQHCGAVVVMDGRLDNNEELRQALRASHEFPSGSDAEVVLAAYSHWGEHFVDRLRGAFSLVVVDLNANRALLARDPLGLKPLYLAPVPGGVRFASTIPALLAAGGIDTSIDRVSLHNYLSWHSVVPAPRTILSGIRKLPPATLRVLEPDTTRNRLYWRPEYKRRPEDADRTPDEWLGAVHEALDAAVDRSVAAGAPTGVLLSGGLDSSLLVSLLAQHSADRPVTYSIGIDTFGDQSGHEFLYSDAVARTYGTEHHRIHIPADEIVPRVLDAVADMAEPLGAHDAAAFHLLSGAVASHGSVVLSGHGADEVFAGHAYHQGAMASSGSALECLNGDFSDYTDAELRQLVMPEWLPTGDPSEDLLARHLAQPGAETALDAVLRLDTHVLLSEDPVRQVDSMGRAWGLDTRLPYLDEELVELAARCPPELKLAHGGKGILRQLGRRLLPIVVNRPTRHAALPGLTHLGGPLLGLVEETLRSRELEERGILRRERLEEMLASPGQAISPAGGNRLWHLTVLELWLQSHGISA